MLALAATAAGSPGDESWAFRRCAAQCQRTGCAGTSGGAAGTAQQCSPLCSSGGAPAASALSSSSSSSSVALALRAWRWDCASDCAYLCMWVVEAGWPAGTPAQKYRGKWAFARLLGMQEPASVLFSLANLAAHVHCLARLLGLRRAQRRHVGAAAEQQEQPAVGASGGGDGGGSSGNGANNSSSSNGSGSSSSGSSSTGASAGSTAPYPYAWLWAGYCLLSANAWLWSAVFHGRDTHATERLDYFSAALLIVYNLFISVVRTCGVRSAAAQAGVAAPLAALLGWHWRRMLLVLFDYGRHVLLCVGVGAATSVLWLGWAARARRHPGRAPLLAFLLAVNACMALEILDFPPLWHALDAHSLWHAATAPLALLFFRFIAADMSAGWALEAAAAASSFAEQHKKRL